MDFRGNLEIFVSENVPEAETPRVPMKDPDGDETLSGIITVGQETESEFNRGEYLFANIVRSNEGSVEYNISVSTTIQGPLATPQQGGDGAHLNNE